MKISYQLRGPRPGEERRRKEEQEALGGMRDTSYATRRVLGHMITGPTLAELEAYTDDVPRAQQEVVTSLGREEFDE